MDKPQIQRTLREAICRCAILTYGSEEWKETYQEILLLQTEVELQDPARKLHRMAGDPQISLEDFISCCGSEPSQWIYEDKNLAYAASSGGQLEKLRWLIKHGVDPNAKNKDGYSPLIYATPHLDAMRFLIECGVDLNATSIYSESSLSHSLMRGNFEATKLLIDSGADEAIANFTTLHQAAAWGNETKVAETIRSSPTLELRDRWKNTPWLIAVMAGRIEAAEQLSKAGADTDVINHFENSALHVAAEANRPAMLQKLLSSSSASPDEKRNYKEQTALYLAVGRNHLEVAEILLAAGANATAESDATHHPINDATSIEMMDLLQQHGANVNHINGCGEWPLKEFASSGDMPAVEWLLDHGTEVDLPSIFGTALRFAVFNDHLDVTNLLLDRGAKIDQVDVDGDTPLHMGDSIGMAVLLLSRGADPTIASRSGIPENSPFVPPLVRNAIQTFREARN